MRVNRILPLILAVVLQVMPMLRAVLPLSGQGFTPSAWAMVLKLAAGTVALLGSYHAVSGATQIVPPYTVNATVGVPYIRQLGTSGQTAHSWSTTTAPLNSAVYPLTPGLWLTNATGKIGGVPTQGGSSSIAISAWEFVGNTGSTISSSFAFTITNATGPPVIFTPMTNQLVSIGANTVFTLVAIGAGPLTYFWQLDGVTIDPATNSSLSLLNVQVTNAGLYTVIVSNPFGSATNSAELAIDSRAPVFTSPLLSQSVLRGSNVTLRVVVSGAVPLTYLWQFNGAPISGATNAALALPNAQLTNAGDYTIIAANPYGAATNFATLTVNTPPSINTRLTNQIVSAGADVTFSVTVTGSATLSYLWRFSGHTILGATNASLLLSGVKFTNAGNYQVVVTNLFGAQSSTASLTVNAPPIITTQPQDLSALAGSDGTFSASAIGSAPISLQWLKDGAPVAGATNTTLTLTNLQGSDSGGYTFLATNSFGSATSQVAILQVVLPNTPPVLSALPDFSADVLVPLRVTNIVTDAELPSQTLTFSLGPGAPAGARINAKSGVFVWPPARAQAASTNLITVIVTDDGVPPLSDSQSFQVIVRDYVELSLGRAVVRAGDSGSVPITLGSSTPANDVRWVVNFSGHLSGWSVQAAEGTGAQATLQSITTNRLVVAITSANPLPTNALPLAHLNFTIDPEQPSAFVPLSCSQASAFREDGSAVERILLNSGRVVAVGNSPLLEALLEANQDPSMILYGPPGDSFFIDSAAGWGPSITWVQTSQQTLTSLSQTFSVGPCTNGVCLFRAR